MLLKLLELLFLFLVHKMARGKSRLIVYPGKKVCFINNKAYNARKRRV